jgi:hypothetical protein
VPERRGFSGISVCLAIVLDAESFVAASDVCVCVCVCVCALSRCRCRGCGGRSAEPTQELEFGGLLSSSNRTISNQVEIEVQSEHGAMWVFDFRT